MFRLSQSKAIYNFQPVNSSMVLVDFAILDIVVLNQLPIVTVTNYHKLSGIKKHYLTVLDFRNQNIKVTAGLYSFQRFYGESISLPFLSLKPLGLLFYSCLHCSNFSFVVMVPSWTQICLPPTYKRFGITWDLSE